MKLLHTFVNTGEMPDVQYCADDALVNYLAETMRDGQLKALVQSDVIAARIFVDTMAQFIQLFLQKAAYQQQRCSFEKKQIEEAAQWSIIKRRDNWQALVQRIDDSHREHGFDNLFYSHELGQNEGYKNNALWESMLNDWAGSIDWMLAQRKRELIDGRRKLQDMQLRNNLTSAIHYIKQHGIANERFYQAWALMGGRWNVLEYERLQQVVDFQRRYPILNKITHQMGRTADPLGQKSIGYTTGSIGQMEHASQSDITGISMGHDLTSLLPMEWAQFMDDDMQDIFLQKYVTHRLQTFGYESHSINAARNLHKKPARPLGPIIVCVDVSGSMMGEPSKIALSLMMQLCEMCERKQRDCFLIAFSVTATPIEVLHDRAQLLQFFHRKAEGSTDARHLMNVMLQLLKSNARYAGADVLWITDFRIPLPEPHYFSEMEQLQHDGTRFYGLQLGMAENHWTRHFDEMYKIEDVKMEIR